MEFLKAEKYFSTNHPIPTKLFSHSAPKNFILSILESTPQCTVLFYRYHFYVHKNIRTLSIKKYTSHRIPSSVSPMLLHYQALPTIYMNTYIRQRQMKDMCIVFDFSDCRIFQHNVCTIFGELVTIACIWKEKKLK